MLWAAAGDSWLGDVDMQLGSQLPVEGGEPLWAVSSKEEGGRQAGRGRASLGMLQLLSSKAAPRVPGLEAPG